MPSSAATDTAITQTSLPTPAHAPSVVTTPTLTSTAQQHTFTAMIAVMGVVIVIAVTAVLVLFIKWRQSANKLNSIRG